MILESILCKTPLGGHPLRSVILSSGFLQNLRGTPLAICDFGIYFMQKPLGRHPLRFVILGSGFLQNLRGTPLAIHDFGIYFMQNL